MFIPAKVLKNKQIKRTDTHNTIVPSNDIIENPKNKTNQKVVEQRGKAKVSRRAEHISTLSSYLQTSNDSWEGLPPVV